MQRLHLGFDEARLQPRGPHLAGAGLARVVHGMLQADDRPIQRQRLIDGAEERVEECRDQLGVAATHALQVIPARADHHQVQRGDDERRGHMHRERLLPSIAAETETAAEPEDDGNPQRVADPGDQIDQHQDTERSPSYRASATIARGRRWRCSPPTPLTRTRHTPRKSRSGSARGRVARAYMRGTIGDIRRQVKHSSSTSSPLCAARPNGWFGSHSIQLKMPRE